MKNEPKKFRSFSEAKEFIKSLGIATVRKWQEFCKSGKKPQDIPSSPNHVYQSEWKGWGDFLGTGVEGSRNQNRTFRSFTEAKELIQELHIASVPEWNQFSKSPYRPKDIPSNPHLIYKSEWKGWGEFLGTGRIAPSEAVFRSYIDAKTFIQGIGLNSSTEWREFCKSGKKPQDIPSAPDRIYGDIWEGWGEFLGTGSIANYNRTYRSYDEVKAFAQKLHIFSSNQWKEYSKSGQKPEDIPSTPNQVYVKEWKGWGVFLGTGRIATFNKTFRSYKYAKEFVQSLGLSTIQEWQEFCKSGKKPEDIPTNPYALYKSEWKGYKEFFGYKKG